MLSFVFRKISNKKWMVISLLLGNLLMVAIAAASPMYSQAILQRTLTRRLNDSYTETSRHPGVIEINGLDAQAGKSNGDYHKYVMGMDDLLAESIENMQVPVQSFVRQFYKTSVKAFHETMIEGDEKANGKDIQRIRAFKQRLGEKDRDAVNDIFQKRRTVNKNCHTLSPFPFVPNIV
jgi:hypothetical protein